MAPALSITLRTAGHICRLALAGVLLFAGVLKALDPEALARESAQYGILPDAATLPFAMILIPLEIVVGTALLLDWRRVLSIGAACGMMALFISAIGFALATDRPLQGCGCFGSRIPRTPAETLAEDAGLLLAGLFALWALERLPARRGAAIARRPWKGAAVAGVAVASTLFTLASPRLPIDNLATALAPGRQWKDLGLSFAERDFSRGRHFVAILGLKDEASGAAIHALNGIASAGTWETAGLHAVEEEALVEFTFMRGPAFPLIAASPSDLQRLYRRLPRFFAVSEGRIAATWSELPDVADVRAALEGETTDVAGPVP